MFYQQEEIEINHKKIIFRSARAEDAEELLAYLKGISQETPFLIREPEEITISMQQQRNFLKEKEESPRELMLLAFEDGNHIGNCSISWGILAVMPTGAAFPLRCTKNTAAAGLEGK